ncbi:hypothetical protein HPB50_028733 [Hyalomma asiaticum]|nr:hypothetical protein HPB50_028733 [Hyalomma asiaticum]
MPKVNFTNVDGRDFSKANRPASEPPRRLRFGHLLFELAWLHKYQISTADIWALFCHGCMLLDELMRRHDFSKQTHAEKPRYPWLGILRSVGRSRRSEARRALGRPPGPPRMPRPDAAPRMPRRPSSDHHRGSPSLRDQRRRPKRGLRATDTDYGVILAAYREVRRAFPPPHRELPRAEAVKFRQLQTECVLTPALARHVCPDMFVDAKCSVCERELATLRHIMWGGCNSANSGNGQCQDATYPEEVRAWIRSEDLKTQRRAIQRLEEALAKQRRKGADDPSNGRGGTRVPVA